MSFNASCSSSDNGGLSCSIISVLYSPGVALYSLERRDSSLNSLRLANDLAGVILWIVVQYVPIRFFLFCPLLFFSLYEENIPE